MSFFAPPDNTTKLPELTEAQKESLKGLTWAGFQALPQEDQDTLLTGTGMSRNGLRLVLRCREETKKFEELDPSGRTQYIEAQLDNLTEAIDLVEDNYDILWAYRARRMPKIPKTDWLPTAATDGKNLFFNPVFIASLTLEERAFVVVHEMAHVVWRHIWRSQGYVIPDDAEIDGYLARTKCPDPTKDTFRRFAKSILRQRNAKIWNLAADAAIHGTIKDDLEDAGMPMLDTSVYYPEWAGRSTEAIFSAMLDEVEEMESNAAGMNGQEGQSGENGDCGQCSGSGGFPIPDWGNSGKGNPGEDNSSGQGGSPTDSSSDLTPPQKRHIFIGDIEDQVPEGAKDLGNGQYAQVIDENGDVIDISQDADVEGTTERASEEEMQEAERAALRQHGKGAGNACLNVEIVQRKTRDWRAELSRFVIQVARSDYSYQRPNRGYLARTGTIIPGLQIGKLCGAIAIDTSGSISQELLNRFAAEVESIRGQIPAHDLVLLCCDAAIQSCQEVWEGGTIDWSPKGGGGTDFRPVFDHFAKTRNPDFLIYFTDLFGVYPDKAPEYPVLWAVWDLAMVKSNYQSYLPKFGDTISLQDIA